MQADITSDEPRLSWIGDAHAQRVIRNGVVIPPRDYECSLRWKNRVQKVRKHESGIVTNGITFIPIFIDFSPATVYLLKAYVQTDATCEESRLG